MQWNGWGELAQCVRGGDTAFQRRGLSDRFAALAPDPQAAAIFHGAMVSVSRRIAPFVARIIDTVMPPGCAVVDVGGGHGELLRGVLGRLAAASGIVFDQPHAADGAQGAIEEAGLRDRVRFAPGGFFEAVPAGDVLLLKSILHDWDDERCLRILDRCAVAARPHTLLVVVERLLSERPGACERDRRNSRADPLMMWGPGGRERTLGQYASLLASTGWAIQDSQPATLGFHAIVAGRAQAHGERWEE